MNATLEWLKQSEPCGRAIWRMINFSARAEQRAAAAASQQDAGDIQLDLPFAERGQGFSPIWIS
jgi:hypothetical protein